MQQALFFLGVVTQRFNAHFGAAGVKDTDHDFFAKQRGQGADTKVNDPVGAHLELHAPVLGHALFGDVQPRDHLDARSQLVLDGNGWRGNLAQFAVDAKAHAVMVFVGLEVQVRGAHVERVQQHLVQKLDDGRIFNLVGTRVLGLGGFFDRDIIELEITAGADGVQGFAGAFAVGLHHGAELVVFGNDPVHAHLGAELDFFGGFLVGGVGRGHDQAVVALAQHHDAVGGADFGVEQFAWQALRVDGVQIEQRGTKNGRYRVRQIRRRHRPRANQLVDETRAAGQ